MTVYKPKGECRKCKFHNPKDCDERMFFLCASSEYNEGMIWRRKPIPDWWEAND